MSQVKPIPDGYHTIQPYLVFKNCAEAIAFYTKAFGAKEKFRMSPRTGRPTLWRSHVRRAGSRRLQVVDCDTY